MPFLWILIMKATIGKFSLVIKYGPRHAKLEHDLVPFLSNVLCSFSFRYQIGLRYTGGARMLLSLSLKFGIIPIVLPVGVRDFDIDGELWVKLRLIQSEPWVGAVSLAFVSLPKIKFELSPFRLFNLMGMSYYYCFFAMPTLFYYYFYYIALEYLKIFGLGHFFF